MDVWYFRCLNSFSHEVWGTTFSTDFGPALVAKLDYSWIHLLGSQYLNRLCCSGVDSKHFVWFPWVFVSTLWPSQSLNLEKRSFSKTISVGVKYNGPEGLHTFSSFIWTATFWWGATLTLKHLKNGRRYLGCFPGLSPIVLVFSRFLTLASLYSKP